MQSISRPALIILMLMMKDVHFLVMILVLMETTLQMMPAVIVAVERSAPILKVGSILKTMIALGTSSMILQVVHSMEGCIRMKME